MFQHSVRTMEPSTEPPSRKSLLLGLGLGSRLGLAVATLSWEPLVDLGVYVGDFFIHALAWEAEKDVELGLENFELSNRTEVRLDWVPDPLMDLTFDHLWVVTFVPSDEEITFLPYLVCSKVAVMGIVKCGQFVRFLP